MKIGTPKFENFLVGSPNIIKSIAQEVIRECNKLNLSVIAVDDEDFVSYVVSLLSLNPSYGLHLSTSMQQFERADLESFVRTCVEKLTDDGNLSLKTLAMQAKFMLNPIDHEIIVRTNREELLAKSRRLTEDIMTAHVVTGEDRIKLLRKIAVEIIVLNGLGHPSKNKIVTETVQAVQSIMSNCDIVKFARLSPEEKETSLKDIREIVCGIRVFNKDAGHPSDGVIDLPQFVEHTCESTKSILDINLFEIMDRVNLLTSAIESAIVFNAEQGKTIEVLPDGVTDKDFDLIKFMLIMSRQQELYVRNLMQHLVLLKRNIDEYISVFRRILHEIHKTVEYKTAIPTQMVYPKFAALGRMWIQLQNQIYILSKINMVNNSLTEIVETVPAYDEIAYRVLGKNGIESDDERLAKFQNTKYEPMKFTNKNVTIEEYREQHKIELLGFCVDAMATGVLLPGNPNIGVVNYQNRVYSVRNFRGLTSMDANPELIVQRLIEATHNKPELIVFLDIFEHVKEWRECIIRGGGEKFFVGGTQIKAKTEIGVQTELHPVDMNKDVNYTWNVWELRRKAIQLANLRKYQTKSAQTCMSYELVGVGTQTWAMENTGTQTTVKRCVGVSREKNGN